MDLEEALSQVEAVEKAKRDCPELITCKEAAKLIGVPPWWLRKRADDYGAVLVGHSLMLFKDIVGKTVGQIIALLSARLIEERQQCQAVLQTSIDRRLQTYRQMKRDEARQERSNRALERKIKRLREDPSLTEFWRGQEAIDCASPTESRCGAPTRNGTPCNLPVVTKDSGTGTAGAIEPRFTYTDFKSCRWHQGTHPDAKCSPLPQTPKPKRSNWTPEMRAAAGERTWKAQQDYRERLLRSLREGKAEGQKQEIKL